MHRHVARVSWRLARGSQLTHQSLAAPSAPAPSSSSSTLRSMSSSTGSMSRSTTTGHSQARKLGFAQRSMATSSKSHDQPSLFGQPKAYARSSRAIAGQARSFGSSSVHMHGGKGRPAPGTGIKVVFQNSKGEEIKTVEGNEGDDIVDLSWEYDLDIEAACEKSIACSTCHVILDSDSYDKLEEPTDEENDMLDMAYGLEDTSRLGCQVKLTRDLDGMTVRLPSATRNFAVDGHKSKH